MHVRLSDPALADEFIEFLERTDWIVGLGEVEAHAEGISVEVEIPEADKTQARAELEVYLRGWETVYPDSVLELLD